MKLSNLKYYKNGKRSGKGWVVACVFALCLTAIVLFVVSARIRIGVVSNTAVQIEINPPELIQKVPSKGRDI